jgi:hypothetical protein
MIDGIELILAYQLEEMRKLHGYHATGLQQDLHPGHKIVQIGHVRENVIADQKIGSPIFLTDLCSAIAPKELNDRWNSFVLCDRSHIRRGFDPEHFNAAFGEVLQQIAVIAGEFDYKAIGPDAQTITDIRNVPPSVRDPTI